MLCAHIRRCVGPFKSHQNVRLNSSLQSNPPPQQEQRNDLTQVKVNLPAYTQEQSQKILQILNNCKLEQLISFDISKTRAQKLYNWQARHGPISQLSDILNVDGFGLKVATKFYNSLIQPTQQQPPPLVKISPKTAPFTTPTLDEGQRQNINSSVAVRIGVTSISWSRLNWESSQSLQLSHWQHHELNDKKLHLSELSRRCLYVAHQIPAADCYVLENPQMAQASTNPGSIDQQNVNIQKAQMTAMMSYALMSRAETIQFNNLFYLRRLLTARLFQHLVGTERVSTEETILNLMKEQQQQGGVQFPLPLRNMFSQMERYQRELLGQALLLNLAFGRLVLSRDPLSLAAVSRSNKPLAPDHKNNNNKNITRNVRNPYPFLRCHYPNLW